MEKPRIANIARKTKETNVEITINLDGDGKYTIDTSVPFFNHLLETFAMHGRFNLDVTASGDIDIDYHHLVEDIGITLGEAFKSAIGKKAGIKRFSFYYVPMDDALVRMALDISGRPYLFYNIELTDPLINNFNANLVEEFFTGFVNNAAINLHVDYIRGKNAHHIMEATFKAFGIVLRDASSVISQGTELPSTKGAL